MEREIGGLLDKAFSLACECGFLIGFGVGIIFTLIVGCLVLGVIYGV